MPTAEFAWPSDLERSSYPKGNKKGEIEVIFTDLETAKKQHSSIGNFPFPRAKAGKDAADTWGKLAEDFFSGSNLKKVTGSLKIIQKRISTLSGKKDVGKDAEAALTKINKCINLTVDSVSPSVINPQIDQVKQKLLDADKEYIQKTLKTVFSTYKACAAKKHPEITQAIAAVKAWPADEKGQEDVRKAVNTMLFDACRDMTQNLNNMGKALEYGLELSGLEQRDIITIPKLSKTLVPIANAKDTLTAGMDVEQLKQLVRTVKVNADLYDEIAKRVP